MSFALPRFRLFRSFPNRTRLLMRGFALLLTLSLSGFAHAQDAQEKPVLVLDGGGHTGTVHQLLFTPDSKQLLTVSEDKTIRIWDVDSGQTTKVLRPPIGPGADGCLYAAALSPDGKTLAVGGFGYTNAEGKRRIPIYLIALGAERITRTLEGMTDTVSVLAFAPDGKRLASCVRDGPVRIWDLEKDQPATILPPPARGGNHSRSIAFSPDSRRLAGIGGYSEGIWNLETGKTTPLAGPRAPDDVNQALAWSPDGKTVAVAAEHGIRLWNADGSQRGRFDFAAATLDFSADSRQLLVNARTNTLKAILLDATTGKEQVSFSPPRVANSFRTAALSRDGKLAATGQGGDNQVYLWKTADGSLVHRLGGTNWPAPIRDIGWSKDSKALAWGPYSGNAGHVGRSFYLGELRSGPEIKGEERCGTVRALDGLTIGNHGNDVQKGGETIAVLTLPTGHVPAFEIATFHLGKDEVIRGSDEGDLFVFAPRTGELLRCLRGHAGGVRSLAPSPDGRFVASTGADRTVCVWEPKHDTPLLRLLFTGSQEKDSVSEWVAWTPEGYYAASPGAERLLGWHVGNGPDQLASYHPLARYRTERYRPDVIQRLLEEGSLQAALEAAEKARKR